MSAIQDTITELIAKNILEITKRERRKNKKQKDISINNPLKKAVSLSIANILSNSENKEGEEEEKQELKLEDAAEEEPDANKKKEIFGGYGTIRIYGGMSPNVTYANYSSIWSHLGNFRATSQYENPSEINRLTMGSRNESTGILVSNEVIEKAQKHFKYFVRGDILGDVGYVPPAGTNIDSKDWEKYRLMTQMSIYMPLLKLFRSVV